MKTIKFNVPFIAGRESEYVCQAIKNKNLAGDGIFTRYCQEWLEEKVGCTKALLTHSCTAALEMAAILADIQPGDEVIMPSYTFVSTANAFVLRGGVPVFVDIRPDTLNIDEMLIEAAITPRTKAIVPVHYAGVACEMDTIMAIAERHRLVVIEDAAQGIMSTYKGRMLGSIGHIACYSFHETKNIHCGEGGAILINDIKYVERAEIIREKGTNRSKFLLGMVDKYTWVDKGSSFLPNELTAAFLWAQLQESSSITKKRLVVWNIYNDSFDELEKNKVISKQKITSDVSHNAHMFYILLRNNEHRNIFLEKMRLLGINCTFHYVPLHNSEYGKKVGRISGQLNQTIDLSARLARLPMYPSVDKSFINSGFFMDVLDI